MQQTLLLCKANTDWWSKKSNPNTVRGQFNWDLFMRVIEAKKNEELGLEEVKKESPKFVSNEDALQQQHEEFMREVEKSGLPEWIIKLYN